MLSKLIKMIQRLFLFLFLINVSFSGFSQADYPQNYFRSPLDIPLVLSGTFGELRGNHFHSGIDIKTQGVVGHKVYAVADGYVSRIKISAYGYGNALYITHPNGYVSVYAHLQRYNDTITGIMKWVQYQRKSFEVEYFPGRTSIRVKKGDLIGLAGNSGSSGGPHLHFEIRKAQNSHPLNPFLFGYKIADNQYPKISRLAVYNYITPYNLPKKEYRLKQSGKKVRMPSTDTLLVHQDFFVGVQSIDQLNGAVNKNGIYRLQYFIDTNLFFDFVVNELDFSQKRYINSYIDYKSYKENKVKYQRSLVQPNNHLLNITTPSLEQGIVHLTDDKAHKIKVVASDFAGQHTVLEFYVRKNPQSIKYKQPEGTLFQWNHTNNYSTKELVFNIPKGALYDDIIFYTYKKENKYTPYSPLFEIYDEGTPLHNYCSISIKADSTLTSDLYSKACILSLTASNGFYYEGGSYHEGFVSTKTRSFGSYMIGVDTVAPVIKNYDVYANKNISKQKQISFTVTDNLSGVKKYRATLDGSWILMEYNPKKNRLFYTIDKRFPKGKHAFKLVVTDSKGNQQSVKMNLIRN